MKAWWLDELRYAGAEHLDADFVAGYDAKSQVDPSDDIAILTEHGLGPGATVLDLGAGTGVFALAAAETGAEVIAADISPVMVAALRERCAGRPNVEVVHAGFFSYEHHGGPVEFVHTRNALHQVPDFWKAIALTRIGGWLRPGGILRLRDLVYDLQPTEVEPAIDAWMTGAHDDPTSGYTEDDFAEHVRGEFSTYSWIFEPMLERCGFEVLDRESIISMYAAYTCRKA